MPQNTKATQHQSCSFPATVVKVVHYFSHVQLYIAAGFPACLRAFFARQSMPTAGAPQEARRQCPRLLNLGVG
jgi:hypothetical protein